LAARTDKEGDVDHTLAKKLLALAAMTGMIIADVALVARIFGYVGFDAAMQTAIVSGIGATIAGGVYLLVRLNEVDRSVATLGGRKAP
jgi:hypothetical protein